MDNVGLEKLSRETIEGLATNNIFQKLHTKVLWGDQDAIVSVGLVHLRASQLKTILPSADAEKGQRLARRRL